MQGEELRKALVREVERFERWDAANAGKHWAVTIGVLREAIAELDRLRGESESS